jgi:CheY-like chemotaxis protein
MKIIVAEDNDENFEIIKEVFSSSKLQIFRAFNGREAVELIKTDSFDLILMDIKMPVLDGFQATRQIRKFNNKIPIIAVTAYAFNADKEMAIKAGCNDFVTKPIDLNQLSKVLARYSSSELN